MSISDLSNQTNLTSIFRTMNYTNDNSSFVIVECNLQDRVYTPSYIFFKRFHATYLRFFFVPGILLNALCVLIFSQPRLANRSTTIVFLRFLALFDIFAVTLKYIRAEINYQSTQQFREIVFLTESFCRTLYVLMNSCISITMWIIVLMSLDKALAVIIPLKSAIWLPYKRAIYICFGTILVLFGINLAFIKLSGIHTDRRGNKYCGLLPHDGNVLDLFTASILPIAIITGTNVVIVIILHRTSVDTRTYGSGASTRRNYELTLLNPAEQRLFSEPIRPCCSSVTVVSGVKRRTSLQVTRMLLAVTLTLIVCNVPNAIYLVWNRLSKPSKLYSNPKCEEITDHDIHLYYVEFYLGILIQDVLSDLPHILNFFLYCLSGQKFRSIIINELELFPFQLRFLKRKTQYSNQKSCLYKTTFPNMINSVNDNDHLSPHQTALYPRKSIEVLFNRKPMTSIVKKKNQELLETRPRC